MMNKNSNILYWYDLFVVGLCFIGLSSVTLLAKNVFEPVLAILSGLCVLAVIVLFFKYVLRANIRFLDERLSGYLWVILLLALVLRVGPFLYVMGGQDQGTYINISKLYEVNHRLYAKDTYRETMSASVQKLYDARTSYIVPSIEKWNRPGSEYSLVFYPMHPGWLSIFGKLLGSDNRVYELTFFSLLTLINFYFLTYYLSKGNKKLSLLMVALLGVNPVHVFMSKFPVGELVALFYASSGFYLLIRYFELAGFGVRTGVHGLGVGAGVGIDAEVGVAEVAGIKVSSDISKLFENIGIGLFSFYKKTLGLLNCEFIKIAFLVFSFLAFLCFMFSRMTFFTYVPFILLMICIFISFSESLKSKLYLFMYFALLLIGQLYSYRYYYRFLRPLYDRVFPPTLGFIFNKVLAFLPVSFSIKTLLIVCVLLFIPLLVILLTKSKRFTRVLYYALHFILNTLPVLLVTLCIFLGYKSFIYLNTINPNELDRWNMSGTGINSLKAVPGFAYLNYVSIPVVFTIILLSIYFFVNVFRKVQYLQSEKVELKNFWEESLTSYGVLLGLLFVLFFLVITSNFVGFMKYDYYNSRYYLTELVPYSILTFVLGINLLTNIIKANYIKMIVGVLALLIFLNYSFFSLIQYSGSEGAALNFYSKINSYITNDALLIMYTTKLPSETRKYSTDFDSYVMGPLRFYYDKNIFVLDDLSKLNNADLVSFMNRFKSVYILTRDDFIPTLAYEADIYSFTYSPVDKLALSYSYYNNQGGCGLHNYEFLEESSVLEFKLPKVIKCLTLPNAYFTRYRNYNLYKLEVPIYNARSLEK